VIEPEAILDFEKSRQSKDAIVRKWMGKSIENEAAELVIQAFDYSIPEEKAERRKGVRCGHRGHPAEFFRMHQKDPLRRGGRTEALCLHTHQFPALCRLWMDKVEEMLAEWNRKNREPLRESPSRAN